MGSFNLFNFIVIIFFSAFLSISASESTLKMVNVLFRHGDRTPVSHYPNDPYKDSKYWSERPGQLTKKGKNTEYQLGKWLRNRYPNIVGNKFDPEETHVTSTDYDRTLMSAQCVLASFFYPKKSIRFEEDIPWMPIPIHTSPCGDDMLLNVDTTCPRIDSENEKMLNSKIMQQYRKNYANVFEIMTNFTGQKVETFLQVDYIFDTLHIELMHNFTLPTWTDSIYEKMKEMTAISFKMITFTHELKRLRGGPLLGKITKDMVNKSLGKDIKSLYIYSAHDSNVATILNTMGVYELSPPPYGATILWELHHHENKGHFVKLFYRNDSAIDFIPHSLVIPGCSEECPLDKWQSLLHDLIPEDWKSECYRPDLQNDQYYILGLSGLCLLLALVLLSVVIHKAIWEYRICNIIHYVNKYERVESFNRPGKISIIQLPDP